MNFVHGHIKSIYYSSSPGTQDTGQEQKFISKKCHIVTQATTTRGIQSVAHGPLAFFLKCYNKKYLKIKEVLLLT